MRSGARSPGSRVEVSAEDLGHNRGGVSPTGLVATVLSSSSIGLDWTVVSNATAYVIQRDGVIIAQTAALTYTNIGLTANTSYDLGRKLPDGCVETPGNLIEFPALYRNAVFGTLQLVLECQEILIGLQIGIAFNSNQQS